MEVLATSKLSVVVGILMRLAPAHSGHPTDPEVFCLGALI